MSTVSPRVVDLRGVVCQQCQAYPRDAPTPPLSLPTGAPRAPILSLNPPPNTDSKASKLFARGPFVRAMRPYDTLDNVNGRLPRSWRVLQMPHVHTDMKVTKVSHIPPPSSLLPPPSSLLLPLFSLRTPTPRQASSPREASIPKQATASSTQRGREIW